MNLSAIKILLVDDEEELRAIIAQRFRRRGWIVTEAKNGKEAMLKFPESNADLVISDLRMPEVDGIALLKWLRNEAQSQVPLVFVTGYADISLGAATSLGAQALLYKPYTSKELDELIFSLLK